MPVHISNRIVLQIITEIPMMVSCFTHCVLKAEIMKIGLWSVQRQPECLSWSSGTFIDWLDIRYFYIYQSYVSFLFEVLYQSAISFFADVCMFT